jgi:O86/O127-antigen biosynthesis beta-1,3-galactosyltransferase
MTENSTHPPEPSSAISLLPGSGLEALGQKSQEILSEHVAGKPLVSVMLCTNQIDAYFEAALASVLSQTLENIEVLVVLNGAATSEVQMLVSTVSDPRIQVIQTNMQGVTFSRNLSLHVASADLIAVLDADDIAYPERLQKQYDFMVLHPEVTILGSNYDTIDANGNKVSTSNLPLDNSAIRRKLVNSNPICHPTTMFRRDAAMAVGGYSGGLAQDYELWVAFQVNPGAVFMNLVEPLTGYRIPVVSKARMSRRAYAQVASAQWRQFALTKSPKWFVASLVSVAKAWFRSRQE